MEQSVSYIRGSVQRYPPAHIPAFQPWLTILYSKRRLPVPFQHSKSRFRHSSLSGTPAISFRYLPARCALVSDTFLLQTLFFGTIVSSPRLAFRHLFVQTSVNIYGAVYSYFHGSVQRYLNTTKAQHLVHRDCSKRLHTHTLTHARTHARTHTHEHSSYKSESASRPIPFVT